MGRIYCIMGKSSSGKDTLFQMLLADEDLSLKTMIPYTTRPMRGGEREGVEYYFCSEEKLKQLEKDGRVIELRAYDTVYGIWKYFTVDDHQIDIERQDYLLIGTLESYLKIRNYYGIEKVIPIYIEVEDGLRLQRALERERNEIVPGYAEMCRRFLADEKDFSEERLKKAGIRKRFENREVEKTKEEIGQFIRQMQQT